MKRESEHALFGWKIGVVKRILGGRCGYVGGNWSVARKKPPTTTRQRFGSRERPLCRTRWWRQEEAVG